jgi:hypothetical protein
MCSRRQWRDGLFEPCERKQRTRDPCRLPATGLARPGPELDTLIEKAIDWTLTARAARRRLRPLFRVITCHGALETRSRSARTTAGSVEALADCSYPRCRWWYRLQNATPWDLADLLCDGQVGSPASIAVGSRGEDLNASPVLLLRVVCRPNGCSTVSMTPWARAAGLPVYDTPRSQEDTAHNRPSGACERPRSAAPEQVQRPPAFSLLVADPPALYRDILCLNHK